MPSHRNPYHRKFSWRNIPKRYLTTDEVASWLRVEVCTIRAWTHFGKIPFVKFGRCVAFDPDEMQEWVQGRRKPICVRCGGLAEWSKAPVLKTGARKRAQGSNP